jgi:hypothetical protein
MPATQENAVRGTPAPRRRRKKEEEQESEQRPARCNARAQHARRVGGAEEEEEPA